MDSKKTPQPVYRDERYELGSKDGKPYLTAGGHTYTLSCHPYEPCLYISDEYGTTAVHNAFDPEYVLQAFAQGKTVNSITGLEYGAKDFCRMAEYAANMVNIQIDEAEKVFGARQKPQNPKPGPKKAKERESGPADFGETLRVIADDPFYAVAEEYPDIVVDYCLVKNEHLSTGRNAHRFALVQASRKLFSDEDGETVWSFDAGKADAQQLSAAELFAPADANGKLNYRKAFLDPPHGNSYTDLDFDKVNAALFPNGTKELEVYEWTTGWTEYFDEGHEWWGALCLTVYDASLDRFVVILASASD